MNLPLLKKVLTDPDEFISNAQLKSLALEILELILRTGSRARVVCAMFERSKNLIRPNGDASSRSGSL